MKNPTCSQCDCVAGCQARERLCPNVEQLVDAAYQEAVSLAKALFKEHYSKETDYANGKSIWGVCDTTAGVISQIDNMVTGLSRKLPAIAQPLQPTTHNFEMTDPHIELLATMLHCVPDDERELFKNLNTFCHDARTAFSKAAIAQPVQQTPKITAYMTSHDEGDMLFFDKEEARQYCEDDSEPEPLVLLSESVNGSRWCAKL